MANEQAMKTMVITSRNQIMAMPVRVWREREREENCFCFIGPFTEVKTQCPDLTNLANESYVIGRGNSFRELKLGNRKVRETANKFLGKWGRFQRRLLRLQRLPVCSRM